MQTKACEEKKNYSKNNPLEFQNNELVSFYKNAKHKRLLKIKEKHLTYNYKAC